MAKKKNRRYLQKRRSSGIYYFRKEPYKFSLCTSIKSEAIRLRDNFLQEILTYGEIRSQTIADDDNPQFGAVSQTWAKITEKKVKASTMRDYRSAMNLHVLPKFGDVPIKDIQYLDMEEFKIELACSAKRVNNILVPVRSVFDMAHKQGIIEENLMLKVDNLTPDTPTIHPLTIQDVKRVIENGEPHYKDFLMVAFFTGMRFGEMAGLLWEDVNLDMESLHINKTLVYGVVDRPKTKASNRYIDLKEPVIEALKSQLKITGSDEHVFLDRNGKPLTPDHVREVIWKPALEKAGIPYRPLIQTRHTFATMMLSFGEDIGWVQKMLGHSSLQMIYTKYYAWIDNPTRNDGAGLNANYRDVFTDKASKEGDGNKVVYLKNVSQIRPTSKKKTWAKTAQVFDFTK